MYLVIFGLFAGKLHQSLSVSTISVDADAYQI